MATDQKDSRPTMVTERLLIRPTSLSDASDFKRYIYSWDVCDTTPFPHPYTEGAAEKYLSTHPVDYREKIKAIFSVEQKSEPGHVIGMTIIKWDEEHKDVGEVGYAIGKPFWGKGYATEATQRMLKWGFEVAGFQVIHANYLSRNEASGRVLEKVGMKREGTLRRRAKKWGKFEDLTHYSLLAEEYAKNSSFSMK